MRDVVKEEDRISSQFSRDISSEITDDYQTIRRPGDVS